MTQTFSLRQQIDEVEYELKKRREVYPRLADRPPHRKSELAMHMARMEAVLATLKRLQESEAS